MSGLPEDSVHIPSFEDLQRLVVPRVRREPASAPAPRDTPKRALRPAHEPSREEFLRPDSERFLRHAAEPHHRWMTLGERWAELGIPSGSVQKRILDDLRRQGLIRLERKGKAYQVHLYKKAYEYLGMPAPKGEGVGGTSHTLAVKRIAELLKKRGYEVHIERGIGTSGKRVDIVAFGKDRIILCEVGLSDVRQELKNLREDLEAGVLDLLLFVTMDKAMLEKVKTAAMKDPVVSKQLHRIKFYLLGEETES